MSSALKKYAFINAKLRTRLSKLLTEEFFNSLSRAHSLIDAIQLLRNTAFAALETIYSQTGDLKMAELELFRSEIFVFKEIERYVDGVVRDFCWALSTYYEIENLKRIVRLWFDRAVRGREIDEFLGYLYRETIHYDLHIDSILAAKDYSGVLEALSSTPYGRFLQETMPEVQAKNTLFAFEIALDKYYYGELLSAIKPLDPRDERIARRLIGVEIDILNINWIIRFKTLYNLPLNEALQYALPFGFEIDRAAIASAYDQERVNDIFESMMKRHKGFTAMLKEQGSESASRLILIERILEFVMMQEVRRVLVGYPFTIGIILAYFIMKKTEIRRVMTVLNAKLYAIKPEEIKSRL